MPTEKKQEFWLRGSLPGIIPPLQPVAHALLQAGEEISNEMYLFPEALLWEMPAGVASVGFHLLHIAGVVDRLATYAKGQPLSDIQLNYLKNEGINAGQTSNDLLQNLTNRLDIFVKELHSISKEEIFELRGVGKAQLPSTMFGLLVHAAEHTMRHTGQLLVTARILKAGNE
ncbi:MAG: DinB family protein [Chitinophagaceae bacterium]